MEQMAGFLNGTEPPPAAAPPPEPSLVTLVSGRDDSPEAAGIFRLFGGRRPAGASADPGAAIEPTRRAAELDKPAKPRQAASGDDPQSRSAAVVTTHRRPLAAGR